MSASTVEVDRIFFDKDEAAKLPKKSTGGDLWTHGSLNNQCTTTCTPQLLVYSWNVGQIDAVFNNWIPWIQDEFTRWVKVSACVVPVSTICTTRLHWEEHTYCICLENLWAKEIVEVSPTVGQKMSKLRHELITYRLRKFTPGSGTSINCHP